MRWTFFLVLTASMGIPLACSDRSPTSPEMGARTSVLDSPDAPASKTPGLTRHVVVVPPRLGNFVQPGVWGSEKAGLTVARGSATLEILSSTLLGGGCFGNYGEISQSIPNGPFSIAGTYTQLIGAFPGKIQYAARYFGSVEGRRITISIDVPALQQAFGPFPLTEAVKNDWSPCLYP